MSKEVGTPPNLQQGSHLLADREMASAAILLAAFAAYTGWIQAHWWLTLEDNWFGWLTPAFCGYVINDRKAKILYHWSNTHRPDSGRVTGAVGLIATGVAILGFACGLIIFFAGALFRAGVGPNLKGTLAVTCGFSIIFLTLPWIMAPTPAHPYRVTLADDPRLKLCALLIYPSIVWILSAPLISLVESQLTVLLLHPIMAGISLLFNVLGLPIEQQGNTLIMPDQGRVGVEEACSGIRSLTACLFAGSFLGSIMLKSFWSKLVLVVAAILLALLLNLGRSLFLTGWAYHFGTRSIEGGVHDSAGYIVMGLTIMGLFGLLNFFTRPREKYQAESM